MIRHFTSFYCRRCGQIRRFTKRGIDHRKHLYATLLTCGLWGLGWLFLRHREQRRSWRCTICQGRQRTSDEAAAASAPPEPPAAISITPRR